MSKKKNGYSKVKPVYIRVAVSTLKHATRIYTGCGLNELKDFRHTKSVPTAQPILTDKV